MEIVVSSIATKRHLVTLDLLGPDLSSGGLDPRLRISSDGDYLPPLDLNQVPDDVGPRREVEAGEGEEALQGGQSVCTIEKVKQALERETERRKGAASDGGEGSLSTSASPSSSSSSSVTTVSAKRFPDRGDEGSPPDRGDSAAAAADRGGSLVVAGCSGCLSYVLIPKGNPRCPRCDARVTPPLTVAPPPAPLQKKPRHAIPIMKVNKQGPLHCSSSPGVQVSGGLSCLNQNITT
ncbi:uncharacterized protein LOC122020502 [Zingiber officinale]|uniref:uncharacterized protein LOC122020502 n=1 Tax=Zingiber officinale TaxID=94328 RepID=UPI001C4BFA3B|nr:uncharacterized protein LOC122020502 [Zingiber officinale]